MLGPIRGPPVRLTLATSIIALLTVSVAGCLGSDAPTDDAPAAVGLDVASLVDLIQQGHDHSDRPAHAGTKGMTLLGHSGAYSGAVPAGASFNEVAAWQNYAYVSRGAPDGGFAIIDIADPTNLQVVGEWPGEPGFDIEVTHDGAYVFFATQRNDLPSAADTSDPETHQPRGLYVVDVRNPTAPAYVSFLPHPWNGVHTMDYVHEQDSGFEILAIQSYDLTSSLVPGIPTGLATAAVPPTQRVMLALFDRDAPDAPRLVHQGIYQEQVAGNPQDMADGTVLYMPHDSFIETHPMTGERLMYVAYWDVGLTIVNIDNLNQPQRVALWDDFSPSGIVALHDAKTIPALIDGMHITVTGPEIAVAAETGQFTFFDTTDPTNPKKLGHWVLPGDGLVIPGDEPFLFSPHVFYINDDGILVVAHNHGGAWMIDIGSTEKLQNPVTLAYAMPVEGLPDVVGRGPSVWTAMWWNDLVLVTDTTSGLYVYEPTVLNETA